MKNQLKSLVLMLALSPLALVGCDDDGGDTDAGTDAGDMMMEDSGPGDAGPPAASCSDGIMNQDETDVDCGGTCGATCVVGEMCGAAGDCMSNICNGGVCEPMPTCMDGVMNATETDVDCGGGACPTCDTGLMCGADGDCTSMFCSGGACTDATCGNGMVEGSGEACDGDGMGTGGETATCNADCSAAMCGDGVLNVTASETCDGDDMGTGGETATCDTDCTAAQCGDGNVNATAGETCDGDGAGMGGETATCDADCTTAMCGDSVVNATAGEQCDDGNMDDTDRCSNACTVNGPSISITADATFDTTTGELDGTVSTGWDAATNTLFVTDFTLAAATTLTVTGTNAFRVVSGGNVVIDGTIDAAGENGVTGGGCNTPGGAGGAGGPGGGTGGNGGGFMLLSLDGQPGTGTGFGGGGAGDNQGGGGGGHIATGLDGTSSGTGTVGAGGMAYNAFGTLEGGSGGGGGSVDDDSPTGTIDAGDDGGGGGGGGGGAVSFESPTSIVVTGTIDASGGNGGSNSCGSASGGGGSGGTIALFSAGTVDFSMGTLNVDGGTGPTAGGDGGDGADGEIFTGVRPTCTDGVANGDETDVDCGGSICGVCPLSSGCRVDGDCVMGGLCVSNFCVAATCTNMMMDGMETDVDCGGPECGPCTDGDACMVDSDCDGTGCDMNVCVSCADGAMNDAETDVDCGGLECGACADGDMCLVATDCSGGVCDTNVCGSCSDGVQNGAETDVDCGGALCGATCLDTQMCMAATDCGSGVCTAMACVGNPPSFTDDFEAAALRTEWSTSGDAVWFVSTTTPIAGLQSAECGNIGNNQVSNLDLSLTCVGAAPSVTFTYRVSTETNFDFLRLRVDGATPTGWTDQSGDVAATTVTIPLTAGTPTLRWQYDKDGSVSSRADTVWIDDVTFTDCFVL